MPAKKWLRMPPWAIYHNKMFHGANSQIESFQAGEGV